MVQVTNRNDIFHYASKYHKNKNLYFILIHKFNYRVGTAESNATLESKLKDFDFPFHHSIFEMNYGLKIIVTYSTK